MGIETFYICELGKDKSQMSHVLLWEPSVSLPFINACYFSLDVLVALAPRLCGSDDFNSNCALITPSMWFSWLYNSKYVVPLILVPIVLSKLVRFRWLWFQDWHKLCLLPLLAGHICTLDVVILNKYLFHIKNCSNDQNC